MAGFLVVKFLKENSVTVVPSSWVKGDEGSKVCAWPPFKSLKKLDNSVKNQETPMSSWQWINVAVMKSAGAVRNNPSSSLATEVEVHDIIKKWLMHAKDRDGGRNGRALSLSNTYNFKQ